LLNEYDADPRAVLARIAAAYIGCGSAKNDDFPGAAEVRNIAAKVMMAAITARRQAQSKESTVKNRQVGDLERDLARLK
jgi:hypothetical protein